MKREETITLLPASPGIKKTIRIVHYGTAGIGPKVYIQAGLHADEAPGLLVAHHLEKLFDQAENLGEIRGEIVLVPMANPIGLGQWRDDTLQGRFHFTNSVNFNRNHVDLVDSVGRTVADKLSRDVAANIRCIRKAMGEALHSMEPEDEAEHLKKELLLLAHDSDIVLDLHCDHEALLHLYMGTPLWPDGSDLAAQMGAEVTLLAKNSGDDPFDEACSRPWWDLSARFPNSPIPPACFSVTVELRGIADTAPGTAERDSLNIFTFLQRREVIKGSPTELPPLIHQASPLTGVDYVKAHTAGIIVFLKEPGNWVRTNEVIAHIINPLPPAGEEKIHQVKSRTEGLLFTRSYDRFARPGRIIAKIAGKAPLRQDEGNLLTQ